MKVAYLVNYYPKVSHTFIRREIAALEALGHEVQRFAIRDSGEVIVDEADKREAERTRLILGAGASRLLVSTLGVALSNPGRFIEALKLSARMGRFSDRSMLTNLAYLAEACLLKGWLRDANAQHVHAHFGSNPAAVAMLCNLLGGPGYSFTSHGPEEFDKPHALSLGDKIERSRFAVAISSFGRSQLMRWCGASHWSKLHIVHCGLDADFLQATPATLPDVPRLVNVGRLSGQKGQLLLVEAFAGVVAKRPDAELVLVGDGELRADIERAIERLGIQKNVRITGWAKNAQVRQELNDARCMVLPSFAEGLPVVIMEALALARPVISTYIAGIPELVDATCGWLVPASAIEPLTAAMLEALDTDVATLAKMGAEGQRRVRAMHDAAIEAQTLAQLFERYAG